MNVLLIGPPGSGKGTQGARLADLLSIEHLATGDLLRAEVEAGTDLGRKAEAIMAKGDLVPDSVIIDLVMPKVRAANARNGYLLDGFPRSASSTTPPRTPSSTARCRATSSSAASWPGPSPRAGPTTTRRR
jgi:adenylate kinase